MKIGLLHDLHLEFGPYFFFPEDYDVDLWLIPGDIATANRKLISEDFLQRFKGMNLVWTPGNHDYYHGKFPAPYEDCACYTFTVEGRDWRVAACPLWTKLNPIQYRVFAAWMSDAKCIEGVTEEAMAAVHASNKDFLWHSGADIFVTHHAPFTKSIHPRYERDALTPCFVNTLEAEYETLKKKPKLWVHGHVHDSFDYVVGETRVLCHPRGYSGEANHEGYEPLVFELE